MQIEILSDETVSAATDKACAFPLTTRLSDGRIVCVYRQGTTKHSHDGILLMQLSDSKGQRWSDPEVAFDGRDLNLTVCMGALCQTGSGSHLLVCDGIVGLQPGVYMFSEEGQKLPSRVFVRRRQDMDAQWSRPALLEGSDLKKAGIVTKPIVLPGNEILLSLEYEMEDGLLGTAATFSQDEGQSFSTASICAEDSTKRVSWCDARLTALADGTLLMMLWTFVQKTEETIAVHRCFSHDRGRTWSQPESTGFVGQITAPVEVRPGMIVAASNHRTQPEGIRLWCSDNAGQTWETDTSIQMWDPAQGRTLGEPVEEASSRSPDAGVWEALATFSYGTPDLVNLGDGSLLLTYYGTLDELIHVRACRFRIKNA